MGRRRRRLGTLVALAALAGACGRSYLDESGAAGGGSGGAGAGAAGSAGTDAAASEAGLPFGCEPGADETCNDEPVINAEWGTCSASGACTCIDGFSVNPATGRCRFGSACVASGADPWLTTVMLDDGDCATRMIAGCSGGAEALVLQNSLMTLAISVCHLPELVELRVVFAQGCPSVLNLKGLGGVAAVDPQVVACLTRELSLGRWPCAVDPTDCALVEFDTVP